MTTVALREKVESADLTEVSDGLFEVTLITEGKGSSGFYSKELLSEYGPAAFGPDVPNFFNHVLWYEDASARDIRTAAAKIVESWYTDEGGEGKVKAKIQVFKEHVDFVEFFMKSFGMSIFVEGTAEFDENTGELMVKSFNVADPYRSVDFVVAPGARGSIDEKVKESAVPAEKQAHIFESMRLFESQARKEPSAASVVDKKDTKGLSLMESDVQERFDKIEASLAALVASKVESAKTEADADAVAEAATAAIEAYDAKVVSIEAADILPSQKASLREAAKRGEDVTSAIESAKAIAAEAKTTFASKTDPAKPETGRLGEGAEGFKSTAWGQK